jgi:hypothetical protein
VATKFHLKHGAKLISENEESNSFEYFIRWVYKDRTLCLTDNRQAQGRCVE